MLVDAGFCRQEFLDAWKPADFVCPSEVVARFGIAPDSITDVIITHVHWDHLDGADLFPNARVWIQKAEYGYHVDAGGVPLHSAIDTVDAQTLDANSNLAAQDRMKSLASSVRLIVPGHDPAVFVRFPSAAPGVAKIE